MINHVILYLPRQQSQTIPLHFVNQVTNRIYHAKYLGFILEECLSRKENIESLIMQLSQIANSYKVVIHLVQKDNKYNIYFAYIYSKMLYGSACYEHIISLQVQRILNLLKVPLIKQMYRLQTIIINIYKAPCICCNNCCSKYEADFAHR